MTLKDLPIGKTATVTVVGGEGALRQHFLDMGIIPMADVTMVKYAPMGDPIEIRIHSYELTLRLADAAKIEIENIRDAKAPKRSERAKAIPHPGLGEGGKYHEKTDEHPLPEGELLTFALAGNQNCGKTTLFNQLTGSNQHVGNFPGVTVDRKSGAIKGHPETEVTDLPGIYSMSPYSSETDEGYVTLVNAKYDANDQLVETTDRTGLWAWKHPHHDGTTTYHKLAGDITFTDVDFGYVPEKTVLHDINLYGRPGQKIAFVGSTGAGKTTITNLINRFYDISDGKIRYDGINISKIKKDDLRRSLGIVLQDTHLFTGTVMENIRYGRLEASDEECIAAARLANADSFIKRLPDGYNTMLTNDGSNLSQGQRQLLAIARAAVADPPVLILDEATSSIDTRTEALVQRGMDGLMYGRTSFVIAHRLSTVRNADCIVVLEQGRIIERGSHDGLIAKKGKYYQLYTGNLAEN